MFALPVIERELRVRARLKSSRWVRILAGAAATLLCGNVLSWPDHYSQVAIGRQLFTSLTALAFAYCLLEGVRQTCDCLSQERREGTLDLLFLTPLNRLEVVLGKLCVSSLDTAYGLVGIAPAAAVVFLFGGVTAGEFWRTQLVLVVVLFVAAACGLLASACSRDRGNAFLAGAGLLGLLLLLPVPLTLIQPHFPTISPAVVLYFGGAYAFAMEPERFWLSLLAMTATGWMLLVAAAMKLRTEVKAPRDPEVPAEPTFAAAFEKMRGLKAPSVRLLFGRGDTELKLVKAGLFFAFFGGFTPFVYLTGYGSEFGQMLFAIAYWVVQIMPSLLLSIAATRVLSEAKHSGALEMLLTTPITPAQIIREGRAFICRRLWAAVIWYAGAMLALRFVFNSLSESRALMFGPLFEATMMLSLVVDLVFFVALAWTGAYFSLRTKNLAQATGQTVFWCTVVPFFGNWIVNIAVNGIVKDFGVNASNSGYWAGPFVAQILVLTYAIGLWWRMRNRVTNQFRELLGTNEGAFWQNEASDLHSGNGAAEAHRYLPERSGIS